MLVLARRKGQAIYIGDDITIIVTEVRGKSVRLAIQAPPHIRVDREEVWMQKEAFHSDRPSSRTRLPRTVTTVG